MGRKMDFDIRKGEEQRRNLWKLKKRDNLCLSREILDVLIFTGSQYIFCDAQMLLSCFSD